MAITLATGEALVGEGNEVAHIDLLIGSKSGPVGEAFAHAFVNESEGHTNLLAVVTPNLPAKPDTVISNKVTIKGAKQAVQLFGPAQAAVSRAPSASAFVSRRKLREPWPTSSAAMEKTRSCRLISVRRTAVPRS